MAVEMCACAVLIKWVFYSSTACAAMDSLCFCFVPPGFCLMQLVFLLLCKNTEWFSMKYVGGNHYNEQIKLSPFGRNWNRQGIRIQQNIWVDVSRCCQCWRLVNEFTNLCQTVKVLDAHQYFRCLI